MDTATRNRNIATWLGDAPQPVRDTTNQLLERIALCVPSKPSTRHKTTSSMPSSTRRQTKPKLSSWVKTPITDPTRPWGFRSRSPRRKPSCRRACATSIRSSMPTWAAPFPPREI